MKTRFFRVLPVLLLLAGCNDSSPVETVRSLTLPGSTSQTLGVALDTRAVCDKTRWTWTAGTEGASDVQYQCDLSATQTQRLFTQQMATWLALHQRNLDAVIRDSLPRKAAIRDKKNQEPALLVTARTLFEQLQAHGDLARYKALVSDSPARRMDLTAINSFFAGEDGHTYFATQAHPTVAKAALGTVTRAVAASGLATQTQTMDVCQTPALLVLSVILTPSDVRQGLSDCEASADERYGAELKSIDRNVADATTQLNKVNAPFTLVNTIETIRWRVLASGTPQVTGHTLELNVRDGETPHRVTQSMGLSGSDIDAAVKGDINSRYAKTFINAMANLVRQ